MRAYFADSHYFIALLNSEDESHAKGRAISENLNRPLVTTEWVLVEVGDAMLSPENRPRFSEMIDFLRSTPAVLISPATSVDFDGGAESLSLSSRQGLVPHQLHFIRGYG